MLAKTLRNLLAVNSSILLNNVNDHGPSGSVIVGDFTAKCSKWYLFHKNNAAEEIPQSYARTEGYSQLVNKPTDCANGS